MKSTKNVAVLFTGGKDSTFAIEKLRNLGFEIACLISITSENSDSYMLHTPNIRMTELSAKALDLPIVFGSSKGVKEEELRDIQSSVLEARKEYSFDYLGSGGLSSEYQRSRLEKIANEIGLGSIAPLWGISQRNYIEDLVIKNAYSFILTSVSSGGLGQKWLGKIIDVEAVRELLSLSSKYQFNAAFEGGEAETLVLDCPLFLSERIEIVESEKTWDGFRGNLAIKKARLIDKKNASPRG